MRTVLSCSIMAGLLVMIIPLAAGMPATMEWAQSHQDDRNDFLRLEGRWVRPDGGYVLELSEVKKDGGLKVAYFNPRPVRVYQARWIHKGGTIAVFVELRDINYPGSKYDLRYDAASDRLNGTYFQAVEKQTYAIEFVRIKSTD
jgi:hypothetical protein